MLPISINGSEPLRTLLDTGMPSPGVALFHGPHVDQLDLDYLSTRVRVGGAGGSGSYQARVSAGATLQPGEVLIERSNLIVLPPIPHFDLGYEGIIGFELLKAFAVGVDYDTQQVVLTPQESFQAPDDTTAVPLEITGNLPYVEARLPGSGASDDTLRLVLDLGAHHAVSLRAEYPAVTIPAAAIERQVGRGLSGAIRGHVGRVPVFELGGYRLQSVVASFVEGKEGDPRNDKRDGNLGIDLMRRFNFTLDYARAALYLKPNKRFNGAFEGDMAGLVLESEDGREMRVAEVTPGSPAAEAGVAVGDIVLAVNGTTVTGRDRMRLGERLRKVGTLTLKLMGPGGDPRIVNLALSRMI